MRRVLAVVLACLCWPFVKVALAVRSLARTVGRALRAIGRACAAFARWVQAKWSEILSYAAVAMIGTGAGLEWGLPVGLMVAGGLAYLEYLIGCAIVARSSGRAAK